MQHGPWSGATRPAPATREPDTYLVIYQRGGVTSSKLDGFCSITDGCLRLFDGSGNHANRLASRRFSEVAAAFMAHEFVLLNSGYRVQWSGDTLASLLEPEMQSTTTQTKKRRLTLGVRQGAPAVEPSGQLPRPASSSAMASSLGCNPTSAAAPASGKGGDGAPGPHSLYSPRSVAADADAAASASGKAAAAAAAAAAAYLRPCSPAAVVLPSHATGSASGRGNAALPSYAPSASSWLPQDHPNHSAQLAQFVAASTTLQRGGFIASARHPDRAIMAAALRQSHLPAEDASQAQAAAPSQRHDPRLESCTHLSGIIARSAGSVHPDTRRWQGAMVETSAGKVFINRGDRVFPHGQTRAIPAHDNIPEVPVGTNVEVLVLDLRSSRSRNPNYAPRADRWWVEGESTLRFGLESIWRIF